MDWLAEQFSAIPGFSMQTDRLTLNRWLARDFALTVSVPATVGRSGPVPLTYYYPYSGQTTADGVTGDLVDLGVYPPATPASGLTEAFWAPARGGIALGAGRTVGVLAGCGPDRDRRLRAGQDLRSGRRGLHGLRCRAGPSPLAGPIRSGSAARREERRGARRGRDLDRAARRRGDQPVQPVPHGLSSGIRPPAPAIRAAPRYGSATRPAPSCPRSRRARRSCSPRTSPPVRRPRRSGAG